MPVAPSTRQAAIGRASQWLRSVTRHGASVSTGVLGHGSRAVSYKVEPPPKTRKQKLRTQFITSAVGSALAVTLYYVLNGNSRQLRADPGVVDPLLRRHASTIRKSDTAEHPRNFQLTVKSVDEATAMLRTNETTTRGVHGSGIRSFSFNQLASNSPIEDDHREATVLDPFGNEHVWSFFGVFDGHSGWAASDRLKRDLVPWVSRYLREAGPLDGSEAVDGGNVASAIRRAFLGLDQFLVQDSLKSVLADKSLSRAQILEALLPGINGSCAILAFYDPLHRSLHVAGTGDCRAVYCSPRVNQNGRVEWVARQLSLDQTGKTPSEVTRLQQEHPGEPNVIANGRVLGRLEPTRAFGDSRLKWTAEEQKQVRDRCYLAATPKGLLSPPYVTAEPIVTTTQIVQSVDATGKQTSDAGFLVLGTDGLFEELTNEEICKLVLDWRTQHDSAHLSQPTRSGWVPEFLAAYSPFHQSDELKIVSESAFDVTAGQKVPTENAAAGGVGHSKASKQFTCIDDNPATHLIRNALGGGDVDKLTGLLSLQYPISRSHRDDISVTVVFFGDDDAAGVKAKL